VGCLSIGQEHDADLNNSCEHQDNSEPNIQVSKSGAAPVESPIELFTFFAHAFLSNRIKPVYQSLGEARLARRADARLVSLPRWFGGCYGKGCLAGAMLSI
jgi:hypothetical protein